MHNRDMAYSFRMINEGLLSANIKDSKDTTPLLYSHRATGFEHEGVQSLAKGDTPCTGSGVRTPKPGVVRRTLSTVSQAGAPFQTSRNTGSCEGVRSRIYRNIPSLITLNVDVFILNEC